MHLTICKASVMRAKPARHLWAFQLLVSFVFSSAG